MGNSTEKELHTINNGTKPIRSIKSALQTVMQISTILFDKPRNVFAQSLSATGKLNRLYSLSLIDISESQQYIHLHPPFLQIYHLKHSIRSCLFTQE